VVVLMGIAPDEALGTVRLSLGRRTSIGDVESAASALVDAWRRLDLARAARRDA
jgi:cysteine desulfurase